MAHPIPTYAQPHGTLAPGQTISVNKYTVQVERYLSQGKLHLNCDRPFRNTTAHQAQPNYRRFCSRLPRTNFGTSIWDDTSCSQEDRRRNRRFVDRCEEGGGHHGGYLDRLLNIFLNHCARIRSPADTEGTSKHCTPHRCCMAQAIERDLRSVHSHGVLPRFVMTSRVRTRTNSK